MHWWENLLNLHEILISCYDDWCWWQQLIRQTGFDLNLFMVLDGRTGFPSCRIEVQFHTTKFSLYSKRIIGFCPWSKSFKSLVTVCFSPNTQFSVELSNKFTTFWDRKLNFSRIFSQRLIKAKANDPRPCLVHHGFSLHNRNDNPITRYSRVWVELYMWKPKTWKFYY